MRQYKKTILNRFFAATCLSVLITCNLAGKDLQTAQKDSSLRREMLLEAEYTPTIRDADKVNILPRVDDPKPVKALIEYSPWAVSPTPQAEVAKLQAEHFGTEPMLYDKRGYVTLGGGNLMNIRGALGYEFLNTEDDYLRISANHYSMNGKLKYLQDDSKEKAKLNDNSVNAFYKHRFEYFDLNVSANYGYTGFNYYGYPGGSSNDEIPDKTQTFQLINPTIEIKSTHNDGVNYFANMSYSYLTKKYGMDYDHKGPSEGDVFTEFNVNKDVYGITYGISAEMHNLFYKNTKSLYYYSDMDNYTNVKATPYFEMEGEGDRNWKLHVGAEVSYATKGDKKFTVAPDVTIEYDLSKGTWLYLHAGGGKEVYSQARIAKENRYLNPDLKIEDEDVPLDARLGIKSSELEKWFFNAYFRYKIANNMHYYYRDYNSNSSDFFNAFNAGLYDDSNLMQAGAQVSFNHRDQIGFSIRGVKNFWDTEIRSYEITKAINVPDFVIDASIDASVLSQLKIRLGYEMQSGRYGLDDYKTDKMKDIQNVSLGANYIFNKSLSFYLQLNNLLNQKYEYWYTYPEQSITAIAGFSFMF